MGSIIAKQDFLKLLRSANPVRAAGGGDRAQVMGRVLPGNDALHSPTILRRAVGRDPVCDELQSYSKLPFQLGEVVQLSALPRFPNADALAQSTALKCIHCSYPLRGRWLPYSDDAGKAH